MASAELDMITLTGLRPRGGTTPIPVVKRRKSLLPACDIINTNAVDVYTQYKSQAQLNVERAPDIIATHTFCPNNASPFCIIKV